MDIVILLVVGFVAGLLASVVVGGTGHGVAGDILVGIVGALIGSWLFGAVGLTSPIGGLPGTIFVAFVGAVVFLVALRVLRRSLRGPAT